ncbi:MAG: leucine-rich repeat protein [Oscillospiraceae bacterium]|nr:leucine-rich repeat protein [Oscillospiraceae bacterium]
MTFKNILSAALAAVIAFGTLTAAAGAEELRSIEAETYYKFGESFSDGPLRYTEQRDGTLSVFAAYTSSLPFDLPGYPKTPDPATVTTLTIPSEVNGKKVTEIKNGAFDIYKNLKSVTIPKTIKTIGQSAFYNTQISKITIPSSVIYIGMHAFENTPLLTKQTGALKYADNWLIECDKAKLSKSVEIKKGTVGIAENLFANCEGITNVTIPSGVKYINEGAFANCSKLTSVTIPGSVKTVDTRAFYNCTALKSAVLKSGVDAVYTFAFQNCSKLTSVDLPDTVTNLGSRVFEGTPFLDKQTGTVKYAGNWAIASDKKADTIVVKDGTIGLAGDFISNTSVKSLTIPASVVYSNLTNSLSNSSIGDIYFCGTEAQWKKLAGDWSGVIEIRADIEYVTGSSRPTIHYNSELPDSAKASKPAAVTGVKATATASTVKLTWDKTSGATQYTVKYSTDGKTWKTKTVNDGKTSVTFKKLTPNTKYYYKVAAKNSAGTGTYSKQVTVTTKKS